ncbi:MAG: glycosyltransferase family 39 protein [Candidatus Levybacteria bacterium]|nr:glycosyltransferase family 39 protein [Candidatus Levybacteria bacterium]
MIFKEKKYILFLVVIVLLAFFLRFYKLGQNPPSLTWDEAAWGYNAYSLGIDGRDEFGRFLPLNYLESFGDFKPPVYAYLDIVPIKLFGLNEFAVRFPSAFFGVLTVLIAYFLTKRIFWNSKSKDEYALFSSLFLAISPWHIMLSRGAFEANVATFFLVGGIWLFVAAMQERKWYIVISSIFFTLSIYTFNTARIVAPILVLLLAILFRRRLMENKKETLVAIIVGILLLLPTLGFLFSSQASLRFKEVNIFSDIDIVKRVNQEIENDKNVSWPIIHNRRIAYAVEYLRHYFDNLSPSFLFIKGDGNPKFSTQDIGQLYLWDLPLIVIGALFLFKRKEGFWWIIPIWLLIGIIPAATARETPHALRIETTLPTFQIMTAYGLVLLINYINKYKRLIIGCLWILLFLNIVYFLHGYIGHYPREFSGEWQYGYKQSIEYVESVQDNYDQIRITAAMGRPYIYYAFYTKTDPKLLRKSVVVKRDPFGFVTITGFLKYRFDDNLSSIKSTTKVLYIDSPSRVHPKGDILKRFYLLNGEEILTAYRL